MKATNFQELLEARTARPTARRHLSYLEAARDERSAPRHEVAIKATIRRPGHRDFPILIRNISLSGFAGDGDAGMLPGHRGMLALPSGETLPVDLIWSEGGWSGFAFARMMRQASLDRVLDQYRE